MSKKKFIFVHSYSLRAVAKAILTKMDADFTCHGSPFVLRNGEVCQAMYADPERVDEIALLPGRTLNTSLLVAAGRTYRGALISEGIPGNTRAGGRRARRTYW